MWIQNGASKNHQPRALKSGFAEPALWEVPDSEGHQSCSLKKEQDFNHCSEVDWLFTLTASNRTPGLFTGVVILLTRMLLGYLCSAVSSYRLLLYWRSQQPSSKQSLIGTPSPVGGAPPAIEIFCGAACVGAMVISSITCQHRVQSRTKGELAFRIVRTQQWSLVKWQARYELHSQLERCEKTYLTSTAQHLVG